MSELQGEPTNRRTHRGWLAVAIVAAALGGGVVGGLTTILVAPAQIGPRGSAGDAGPTGPTGPAGQATALNTNVLGYCVNVNYYTYTDSSGTSNTWVSGVYISAPAKDPNSGTLSCPSGQFVSLTPTSS